MTSRTVDSLTAKLAHRDGTIWAAELLLTRAARLLPRLIVTEPADNVARDTLVEEMWEFLREDRPHPLSDGAGAVGGEVDAPAPSPFGGNAA